MTRVRATAVAALLVLAALAGCSGAPGTPGDGSVATTDDEAGATEATATETGVAETTGTTAPAPTSPSPADSGTEGTTARAEDGPTATFLVGENRPTVSLEVADTHRERRRGLMNRTSLAEGHGMVFVFENATRQSFWMKNTLVPLDMIFVAPNGTVLNVEHAEVQPNASVSELKRYRSEGPAKYVIEVNRGFANETGVGPGTEVRFDGLNGSNGTATDAATETLVGAGGLGVRSSARSR